MSEGLEKRLLNARTMQDSDVMMLCDEAAAELKAQRTRIEFADRAYEAASSLCRDVIIRAEQAETARDKALADVERLREVVEEAIVISCTDCSAGHSLIDPPWGQYSMGCRHVLPTGHETHCQAWEIHNALYDAGLNRAALKETP